MDVLEYTINRLVLKHKRTIPLTLGATFIGAGIVLCGFVGIDEAYIYAGIPLVILGIVVLLTAAPESYITLDRTVRKLEIQRRSVLGKKELLQFNFEEIEEVRIQDHPTKPQQFRVEVKAKNNWHPLTKVWLKDSYTRESLAGKMLAFLEAKDISVQ